ncbi:hypothetical protein DEJ30_12030 [Curtobacterium sp. MCPF17_003]|uniref:hypothetical protein n=1 Tax=Curtobacterium sp. MCPF17_003 TaxID=2175637 RepID=UPI000D9CB614|nr:hypothetical protein [Curtobacterium sp. MCPF17_003]PYY63635.1 hypothetical protein DEJ30_12030 [Curtobacterium sp. MCPF17_003]
MPEQSVQVPVSQCSAVNDGMEGVRCQGDLGHAELHWADVSGEGDVTEWGDNDELWEEIDRLRALLSQPTPTAETVACPHWEPGQITMRNGCTACRADAAPPSIAAMVPGTTFTAAATSDIWRWAVRTDGQVVSGLGIGPKSSIDPSTIRDVTPPAVTT